MHRLIVRPRRCRAVVINIIIVVVVVIIIIIAVTAISRIQSYPRNNLRDQVSC